MVRDELTIFSLWRVSLTCADLTNALKIRRAKEVCVYRTVKPEDKKALLAAFRQVSQELGEKKRKETEKEQERRKSIWQGDVCPLPR